MSEMTDLLNQGSKIPAFRIVIEGKDATQTLDKRLLGMTLTDNRGFEADQLDLELDDADGTDYAATWRGDFSGAGLERRAAVFKRKFTVDGSSIAAARTD